MMRPTDNTQMVSLIIYFALLALGILGLLISNPKAPDVQLIWLFVMLLPVPYYFTVVGLFRLSLSSRDYPCRPCGLQRISFVS